MFCFVFHHFSCLCGVKCYCLVAVVRLVCIALMFSFAYWLFSMMFVYLCLCVSFFFFLIVDAVVSIRFFLDLIWYSQNSSSVVSRFYS